VNMAEKAAVAINRALQSAADNCRTVKLFFVATVEAGRVRADDFMTINKVLESMALVGGRRIGRNTHGVIINKCSFLEDQNFIERGKFVIDSMFQTKSKQNKFPTGFIQWIPRIDELENASNKQYQFQGLETFISRVPGFSGIEKVSKIDVRNIEEQISAAKKANQKRIDELKQFYTNQKKENEKIYRKMVEDNRRHMQEKLDTAAAEMEKKFRGQLNKAKAENAKRLRKKEKELQKQLNQAKAENENGRVASNGSPRSKRDLDFIVDKKCEIRIKFLISGVFLRFPD